MYEEYEIPFTRYANRTRTFEIFERNTYVIILNYKPLDENEHNPKIRKHMQQCDRVRRFFENHTNSTVHCIQMNPGDTSRDFNNRFFSYIAGLGIGNLIITYYHGLAGENGVEYEWNFGGPQQVKINAYDFIKRINQTWVDCLLILDCFVATRFQDKWKRGTGFTEIVGRGAPLQDSSGHPSENGNDFVSIMTSNMEGVLQSIRRRRRSGRAPRSINQVMASDTHLASNPLRIWLHKPKRGCREIIKRIMIYPPDIREQEERIAAGERDEESKIRFFAVKIQPGNNPNNPGNGGPGGADGGDDGDEGFDEPDESPGEDNEGDEDDTNEDDGDNGSGQPPSEADTDMSNEYPPLGDNNEANERQSGLFLPYWP